VQLLSSLRDRLGWLHLLRRAQLPIMDRLRRVGRDARVLDVGCADGRMARHLAVQAGVVIACEPSASVRAVRRRPNLIPVRADGNALPFAGEAFDTVVLSSVIQMMPDASGILREVRRVLKPDGRIVLTCPVGYRFLGHLFDDGPVSSWARRAFRVPPSFAAWRLELNRRHGATGPGFLSLAEIEALLLAAGLELERWEYGPRALGSFAYELVLLLQYRTGRPLSASGPGPMLLYPLMWLDRRLPARSVGCEVVATARRLPS
jgi:SAM-dependent methyltransferase